MTDKKRVYLSGPISNTPGYRATFAAEAARLRSEGHFVINPAELDLDEGATWADYMKVALVEMLSVCTSLVMLPGWESSKGTKIEHDLAQALGYEITYAEAL